MKAFRINIIQTHLGLPPMSLFVLRRSQPIIPMKCPHLLPFPSFLPTLPSSLSFLVPYPPPSPLFEEACEFTHANHRRQTRREPPPHPHPSSLIDDHPPFSIFFGKRTCVHAEHGCSITTTSVQKRKQDLLCVRLIATRSSELPNLWVAPPTWVAKPSIVGHERVGGSAYLKC